MHHFKVLQRPLRIQLDARRCRAVHLEMESSERRGFVIWRGACGDAVRASLAVRDEVQSAKEQAHTIAWQLDNAIAGDIQTASLGCLFHASVVKILARCAAS